MIEDAKIVEGEAVADPERDLLKMAVIERHRATGNVGKAFINGFGLKRGALAGSVAHDHHNLVVIGADDASMRRAARAVIEMGGGLAVGRWRSRAGDAAAAGRRADERSADRRGAPPITTR